MKQQFELLRATRNNLLVELESNSAEDLFHIPESFNNHILWHIIHVLVSQQVLCYLLSQNPPRISMEMIGRFKNGTKPTGEVDAALIEFARTHLLKTVDQLEADYEQGLFKTYSPRDLSYGFRLECIEDGICYNNTHEAMHYGQLKMIKKAIHKSD